MPSPATDPLDPLAGPTNADAAGRSTPYGPHTAATDAAAGGADSSPLDTQPTDAAERQRPEFDPARR